MLTALKPKRYVYNGKANTLAGEEAVGLIAQDVQGVVPYAVGSKMAKLNPDDATESEILVLDTTPMLYIAINAIKELNERVAELKKRLAEVE